MLKLEIVKTEKRCYIAVTPSGKTKPVTVELTPEKLVLLASVLQTAARSKEFTFVTEIES